MLICLTKQARFTVRVSLTRAKDSRPMRMGKLDSNRTFRTMWGAKRAIGSAFNNHVHWHPANDDGVLKGYVEGANA